MTSGRRLAPELIAAIQEQTAKGAGPAAALAWIEKTYPARLDLPDLRTVQRYVRQFRYGDAGDPWTLPSTECDGSAVVLAVLGEVIRRTEGRVTQITKGLASWIRSVQGAAPDLDLWSTYLMARLYLNRAEQGVPATDLDHYLALSPWRSQNDLSAYERAVAGEQVVRAPLAMNFASRVVIAAGTESHRMPPTVDPDMWDQFEGSRAARRSRKEGMAET
jgi:hypothetical protein